MSKGELYDYGFAPYRAKDGGKLPLGVFLRLLSWLEETPEWIIVSMWASTVKCDGEESTTFMLERWDETYVESLFKENTQVDIGMTLKKMDVQIPILYTDGCFLIGDDMTSGDS